MLLKMFKRQEEKLAARTPEQIAADKALREQRKKEAKERIEAEAARLCF